MPSPRLLFAKFFVLPIFFVFLVGILANRLVNCLSNVKGKARQLRLDILVLSLC